MPELIQTIRPSTIRGIAEDRHLDPWCIWQICQMHLEPSEVIEIIEDSEVIKDYLIAEIKDVDRLHPKLIHSERIDLDSDHYLLALQVLYFLRQRSEGEF